MEVIGNRPLDTSKIAELICDKDGMFLVWPMARWPFDHRQWMEALDAEKGNVDFLVYDKRTLVGHAELLNKGVPGILSVSFLYLMPNLRSHGFGGQLIRLLAEYAATRLGANKLRLVVRDYNPRAIRCYLRCGFREYEREGTLIWMEKELGGPVPL